ncbi:ABC transporter permease [Qiania dongpingensis]|uniref:ABC transporter permease n=1 Tax=Qiania dongpingensis TaxID=2763669 RepID=A0A7G9G7P2_9FIRM|nr:ABC transporter permease [Qiania dongpingensis]QNM06824.1 ABC transporter permease [Qiania dongpingensis]
MAAKSEKKILGMERETFRQFMGKYGISVIMVIMIIAIAIYRPVFLSGTNIVNIITQISINGMLAFGMCLAITTGGIDLTVGAQLAVVGVIMGQMITNNGLPIAVGILIGVAVSTLFGFINGFLIARFNMFPFVVTLSMQLIIRGAAQVISGGKAITFGAGVKNLYYGKLFGVIPYPIVALFVVFVIMYIMFHWTKLGRYILAVGGNANAAVASGVSEFRIKVICYTISGFLAGIAAVIMAAKTGSGQSNLGVGYETDAVAASVIGGTSFAGGIATMPGVLMGIFIVGFIYNGINLIGINANWQSIIRGAIIIGTVMLDMAINGRNRK